MTPKVNEQSSSLAIDLSKLETLESIQRRILWLATSIIHHANHVRRTQSGLKVGGHQASSASMVSIMTALYFHHLRGDDRVSVKPHAAPVLHAINYLLGELDRKYLLELRAFHGLQSYPSRTKDPDRVDFSTGSVGIGATATIWRSLAQRYLVDHFDVPRTGRHVALVGDAELDEGAIWEALVDSKVPRLGDLTWIIDVNRQSLDRVVPDIAVGRIGKMFEAAGWNVVSVKYGRYLREIYSQPGGDALQSRIDSMSNEEYQHLLRCGPNELRLGLSGGGNDKRAIERVLGQLEDSDVLRAIRDLGGHDLSDLITAFRKADETPDRPTAIFAYTIKGWGLPIAGHPANHSALLSETQWRELALDLGVDSNDPWARFDVGTEEEALCRESAEVLAIDSPAIHAIPAVPIDVGRTHTGKASTQQALGRLFVDISHAAPEVASRIVTVSPDVASSTNLGGWINRVGIWNIQETTDWFADDRDELIRWKESKAGQHIELGIAEGNLVGLLGELGATWSRDGQALLPIGTLYDPFVNRALEPWSFGMYAGGQSILIGTPSGVTLAPEGGAHQSIITPAVGLQQPGCVAYEPAFGQDLEWILLRALSQLGHPEGTSSYLRLSTRVIDQELAWVPSAEDEREQRRRDVIAGGYMISRADTVPRLTLVGLGAVMPNVMLAAAELAEFNVDLDVICLTSPDLIFRAIQCRRGLQQGDDRILDLLFAPNRKAPIISVIDGHPHTLSFLSTVNDCPITCLGVSDFGQSGDIGDLYRHFGIDSDTIVGAAWDLIEIGGSLDARYSRA